MKRGVGQLLVVVGFAARRFPPRVLVMVVGLLQWVGKLLHRTCVLRVAGRQTRGFDLPKILGKNLFADIDRFDRVVN